MIDPMTAMMMAQAGMTMYDQFTGEDPNEEYMKMLEKQMEAENEQGPWKSMIQQMQAQKQMGPPQGVPPNPTMDMAMGPVAPQPAPSYESMLQQGMPQGGVNPVQIGATSGGGMDMLTKMAAGGGAPAGGADITGTLLKYATNPTVVGAGLAGIQSGIESDTEKAQKEAAKEQKKLAREQRKSEKARRKREEADHYFGGMSSGFASLIDGLTGYS